MKKIIICIGANEINRGKVNVFTDYKNRGVYYWKKNNCWNYFEIEVEDDLFKTIDDKIKEALEKGNGIELKKLLPSKEKLMNELDKAININ